MKKVLMIFSAIGLIAGCAKAELASETQTNKISAELFASVEENGDCTRTELGQDNVVKWVKIAGVHEDSLSVLSYTSTANNDKFNISKVSGDGKSATFKGQLSEDADVYYALFPQSDEASFDGTTIIFKMPQEQTYVENSFGYESNPSVGKFTFDTRSDIQFKNICGAFKISLTGEVMVGKIALQDPFGVNIWGTVKLAADENIGTASQTIDIIDGSNTIYLNCGDGVQLSGTPTVFYFVVPAGAINHGFNLYVYDTDDNIVSVIDTRANNKINRSKVRNMGSLPAAAPVNYDLSKYGTANCYIVNAAGTYTFKATMGNDDAIIDGIDRVGVLWETFNKTAENPNVGDIVNTVGYSSNTVSFIAPGAKGNALIAAYNSTGDIIWSWHIWSRGKEVEVKKYTGGERPKLMRENLGSLYDGFSAHSYGNGFFYQWGRKDPLAVSSSNEFDNKFGRFVSGDNPDFTLPTVTRNSDASIGTIEYATKNPTEFIINSNTSDWMWINNNTLWSNEKTIYDPCPAGYKVPTKDNLNGIVFTKGTDDYHNIADGTEIVMFTGRLSATNPAKILISGSLGRSTYWWTSTSSATHLSYYFMTGTKAINPGWQLDNQRHTGRSVRCIVDEDAFVTEIGGSTE